MRRTRTLTQLTMLSAALMSACGGSGQQVPPATVDVRTQQSQPDHADLISKVYDTAYRTPDGFYVDDRAGTEQTYTVYHVKDSSVSYELCTDDFYQAQSWEAADNESRAVNGHFVESRENSLYFEFTRELTYPDDVGNVQGETSLGFARVFKCTSVSRNGVDRHLRDGFGGTLNSRPLTDTAVRNLTEYLWQFEYFESSARKVLASTTTETNQAIEQTLRLALLYNQGYDRCDRIEVVDWIFSANKDSGEITRRFAFQYAVEAQRINGTPVVCSS